MKVSRKDGSATPQVLAAMISTPSVCGRIASRWEGRGLFPSDAANVIGSLCVEHHRKHGKNPGKRGIAALAEEWSEGKESELVDLVGRLLRQCLDVPKLSSGHSLDLAGKLFDKTVAERVGNQILQFAEAGKAEKAFDLAEKLKRVELGAGAGVDLLNDREAIKSWFDQERRVPLITYPGAAGMFFRDAFCRGAFVSFLAPEKGNKSTFLLDLAYRAIKERRNVAYFDAGDNTEDEVGIRFLERIVGRPSYSSNDDGGWPCSIKVPKSIKVRKGEEPEVQWTKKRFSKPLNADNAWEAVERFQKVRLRSKRPFLKVSCRPNLSLSVGAIKSILQGWALQGWNADVVVIDYADLLLPPPGRMEPRDATNKVWQLLRSLSQEMHCLVVTATQAKAASYKAAHLGMEHFSEDKRKLAHCTAQWGINRTGEEKDRETGRLNQIVVRKGKFSSRRQLHYAGCLAIANPMAVSCFTEKDEKPLENGG